MENIRIINTGDGSHTLFNASINETYHSSHGALTESKHVFIKNGLEYFADENPALDEIRVFEMGFGTGLNAVLAWKHAVEKDLKIEYQSIEAFPVGQDVIADLNYFNSVDADKNFFRQLHSLSWDELHNVSSHFFIKKIFSKIEDHNLAQSFFHVVFYDAFAPSKQGEVWSIDVLKKMVGCLIEGGVFVTYCAKGQLKRDLKTLGCDVQTLQGPPGKKEMVRAVKTSRCFQE